MTTPNPATLEFLQTRRSRSYKTLTAPVPTRDELHPILTAGARTPDHGKLEPWRFIVLEKQALARFAALTESRAKALDIDPDKAAKATAAFANASLVVAVISAPQASDKIPEIEQVYSAGAVCLALLNAALASGWGANWISGWPSHDRIFLREGLNLQDHETLAGFIHIGTSKITPPDRPRPDIKALTTWMSA